ncbi:hypothetical protein SO802_028415 [Lithocarpus litseifolius]|uniref:Methionyl/Leucyl tRNA synthetase domain-containing protein n=1 Tax=Lithocarpus litseifolius TaxID=425828 RepID=A0AAW2BQH0_9ROSI
MGWVYERLLGKKVVFIISTDKHGEKITTAAAVQGSDPNPKHESIVKEFYSRVLANGDICIYMKEFIVSTVRSIRHVSALSEYTGKANLQSAVSSDQQIWNDINIGESEADKDHTLLELERQCLEVYRPKVEEAANAKARLHCQGTPPLSVAAEEAELATLMAERLHQDFGLFVDLVKCDLFSTAQCHLSQGSSDGYMMPHFGSSLFPGNQMQCHLSQGSSGGYMMSYFGTPLFARNQMQGHPNQFWGSGSQVPNTDQLSVYGTQQHHIINLNHLDMLQAQQHGHQFKDQDAGKFS